jgi:hypothetical protein
MKHTSIIAALICIILFATLSCNKEQDQPSAGQEADYKLDFQAMSQKVKTNKKSLNDQQLLLLVEEMERENPNEKELNDILLRFYSLNAEDLEKVLARFRKAIISPNDDAASAEQVRTLNQYTMKKFNRPFHLASLVGQIKAADFHVSPLAKGKTYECELWSLPREIGYGGITLRPVWATGISTKERLEGGGCQYVVRGYNKDIKNIANFNAHLIAMITAHGNGGKLYASNREIFVNIAIATAFGYDPFLLTNSLKIKRD